MSGEKNSSKEINEAVLAVGRGSLDLIQRFLSGRLSREEMLEGLSVLQANDVLIKYWNELTSDAQYVPHWKVLQTLQGIVDEMAYQLAEYGDSSLYEDIKEVAMNLTRIAERNNEN